MGKKNLFVIRILGWLFYALGCIALIQIVMPMARVANDLSPLSKDTYDKGYFAGVLIAISIAMMAIGIVAILYEYYNEYYKRRTTNEVEEEDDGDTEVEDVIRCREKETQACIKLVIDDGSKIENFSLDKMQETISHAIDLVKSGRQPRIDILIGDKIVSQISTVFLAKITKANGSGK